MSYGGPHDGISTGARALLLTGSLVRVAYGAGALLAPAAMVSAKLAPSTHELADPRLTLRAFGGHQLLVGSIALASMRSWRRARNAAVLSLLIDTLDVAATVLEQRARGRRDETLAGGYRISGTGMVAFAWALCALWRGRSGGQPPRGRPHDTCGEDRSRRRCAGVGSAPTGPTPAGADVTDFS